MIIIPELAPLLRISSQKPSFFFFGKIGGLPMMRFLEDFVELKSKDNRKIWFSVQGEIVRRLAGDFTRRTARISFADTRRRQATGDRRPESTSLLPSASTESSSEAFLPPAHRIASSNTSTLLASETWPFRRIPNCCAPC